MAPVKKFITKINNNVIARNIILAVSGIVVFIFVVSIGLTIFTRHNQHKLVPDFSGLTLEQAQDAARKGSFRVEVNDSLFVPVFDGGVILDQLPKPGSEVKSERRIFVTVNSYRQKMVKIPYVTGFSLRQAKNNLEVAGLEIEKLIFRTDIATNYVLEEQFKGKVITEGSGLEAEQGSSITLIVGVSSDEPSPSVPKVVGFSLREAKSRLWEAGLNVGTIEFDQDITLLTRNEARVYVQSPEQSLRTPFGTPVKIRLAIDDARIDKGSSSSDKAARGIITRQQAQDDAENQQETIQKPNEQ